MLTAPYRILRYRDWPCLLCLVCNRITHRRQDIEHHYCGHCGQFLDDLPADCAGELTEGRSPGLLLAGAESEPVVDPPPAHVWERPALPARPRPWEKPVAPAIAACGLCDPHGFVDVEDARGTRALYICEHDPDKLSIYLGVTGYQLLRADRSREPPLPAAEGGAAP